MCHVYLNVSQDPVTGRDQSMAQFWSRITTEYHQMLPSHITTIRPWRSLQARWQTIMTAIGKLRGCVRQIENLNPSGASEQDIFEKAKDLLMQEPKYQKGFKFDHVWPILKNMEKYADTSREKASGHRKRSKCNEMSPS
ncbi:hypothetical protein K2173_001033 [Erythroxylum novogranatense]|uniref:No apical meristem-associated C-terminal domain-containing protein n=1 Tax=Erythroxylum novogranatense TaxID=1862640 RepID=A0AAV8SIG1_9ROSI|nr:hypothetical protein K2173_001033 [Erythroxylum novogranatense]